MPSLVALVALLAATACSASPVPDAKSQSMVPWPGSLYYYPAQGYNKQGDFKDLSLVRIPEQNVTSSIVHLDQPIHPIYLNTPAVGSTYANLPSFLLSGTPAAPLPASAPTLLNHLHLQLAEPEAMDPATITVPLFAVSQDYLQIDDCAALQAIPHLAHAIQFKKPMPVPLATVNANVAVPAIPVFLREPLYLTSPQALVAAPTAFAIERPGQGLMPFHVGAVLAPVKDVSAVSVDNPIKITMVLAVPAKADKDVAITINLTINIQGGTASVNVDAPTTPTTTTTTEETDLREPYPAVVIEAANLVPIVSFPADISDLNAGFGGDAELDNREPPMPLAPAGIISSNQPTVQVVPFENSKDNPFLIAMQEEAHIPIGVDSNSPFFKPISVNEFSS